MKNRDIEIFDLALSKFYFTMIDLHCTEKMIAFRRFACSASYKLHNFQATRSQICVCATDWKD